MEKITVDFTREPIIETVITPKEGCKIVVRSSKGTGQEEYFVDAVEVISFGSAFFYRSLERPKSFLVPVTDYEIVEVREARMVLKHVGLDRSIKIGGGKTAKEPKVEKEEAPQPQRDEEGDEAEGEEAPSATRADARLEKKRDRRRQYRRRRGREEQPSKEEGDEESVGDEQITLPPPRRLSEEEGSKEAGTVTSLLSSLLPPPPTLISETIARYKDNAQFKSAFFLKEEAEKQADEVASQEREISEAVATDELVEEYEQTFESILHTEALQAPAPCPAFEDEQEAAPLVFEEEQEAAPESPQPEEEQPLEANHREQEKDQ